MTTVDEMVAPIAPAIILSVLMPLIAVTGTMAVIAGVAIATAGEAERRGATRADDTTALPNVRAAATRNIA
jgi:hypothetical protein